MQALNGGVIGIFMCTSILCSITYCDDVVGRIDMARQCEYCGEKRNTSINENGVSLCESCFLEYQLAEEYFIMREIEDIEDIHYREEGW